MFKRRRFFRRPANSRFRGPKPLGRSKDRITRVQRAQMFLRTGLGTNEADPVFTPYSVAFQLAAVGALTDQLDISAGTGTDRALSGMIKSIDITRLHFDYEFATDETEFSADTTSVEFNRAYFHLALVVDRLDPSGAPAAAASVPWFTSQSPVAVAGSTTPALAAREENWPQRVLWERTEEIDTGIFQISDTSEGLLYAPNFQNVRPPRSGYLSKNIKVRLDQQEGLYLVATVAKGVGNPSRAYNFWAHGALYYRVNI